MRPLTEHTCAHCHAKVMLRGARIFDPRPCPACGKIFRARDQVGGYRLGEKIARSGLGVIFRTDDPALAIKLLNPPLAASALDAESFVAEVRALVAMDHPHCLRLVAAGLESGVIWIAMEWLRGGSLADRLARRGALPEAEALALGVQAASALAAAHAAGHGHYDLEPGNFVFANESVVKITDFGQAALYQCAADDLGAMWGRACYVSPERLHNEIEGVPSDIYSLGAVLFHALAGTPLYDGEPHGQMILEFQHSARLRVEDSIRGVHPATARALNRMLAADPSERIRHWSEVIGQLTAAAAALADQPAAARSREAPAAGPPHRAARADRAGWFWWLLLFALAVLTVLILWPRRG